jgi:CBS domain-containing protein
MKGHARNIMTHHASAVVGDTKLDEVARLLVDARIGGVPVVDEDERVIGFVSETDLMATLVRGTLPGSSARDVMSHPPIVVDEFATTDEVMTILRTSQIHHLPVVRSGRLVGIITPLDILRYFVEKELPPPQELA